MADDVHAFSVTAKQATQHSVQQFSLYRLPLLLPAGLWVLGLMLVRTDALPLSVALGIVIIVNLMLLGFRRWRLLAWFALACLWGITDLGIHARQMQVPDDWLGSSIEVTAKVESVQRQSGYKRLLVSDIQRSSAARISGHALLYVYGRRDKANAPFSDIQPGDRLQARVRLHLPRNHLNPGAFDYRAWCFDRSIAALGSASGEIKIIERHRTWIESARKRIRQAIWKTDASASGILSAVLLGDRSHVGTHENDVFSATGTAHLLAISGMHVGMAAAWLFAMCWWLLTRREAWMVHWPVRSISLLAGLFSALAYASLAGWPLPAIRSGCMLAAGVLAWLLAEKASPFNTLLAALMLILIVDPSAIASLSLWLSFLATAGILLWAGQQHGQASSGRLMQAVKGLFWVSLLAMLATLPVIVSVFGRVPLYGLPSNLLMVPLYGLFVMPLSLAGELMAVLGLEYMASGLLQWAALGIRWGLELITMIAALPLGRLWAVHPDWLANGFYTLLMALAAWQWLKEGSRIRIAGLLAAGVGVYLLLVVGEKAIDRPSWLVWDVGQGAASTLLLPHNHVIVVDVPGRSGSRFNGGTRVAEGLRSMGISHVDVLVLSHAQSDHLGGALSLIGRMNNVGEIWLPDVPDAHHDSRVKGIVAEAGRRHIAVHWLVRGQQMKLGRDEQAVSFKVLWPPKGYAPANANNVSLVLTADVPDGGRLMWPGDIEAASEAAIVSGMPAGVDAMLMPHHGSSTSSSQSFIEALRPTLSIAQTGFANRYGFPHASVVHRYERLGSNVYDTADGAVLVEWTGASGHMQVDRWRSDQSGRRDIALQWWRGHL